MSLLCYRFESIDNLLSFREVRSAKGKGTGIPQSLRAAARVLSCASLEGVWIIFFSLHIVLCSSERTLLWTDTCFSESTLIGWFSELNDMEEEATQNDGRLGRRPLKNVNREIQAHQLLLSHITKLIDQYNASAKVLSLLLCVLSSRSQQKKWACTSSINMLRLLSRSLLDYAILAGPIKLLKVRYSIWRIPVVLLGWNMIWASDTASLSRL